MDRRRIEAWALEVIDLVSRGRSNEDSLVELKSDWPDSPEKAARRIAGHANAARGEPILWLIGVDPARGVTQIKSKDPAVWLSQVFAQFDGLAPPMIDVNLSVSGKLVVALLFETDRAPFVVKNPAFGLLGGGPVQLEVPYREGTAVRSATRHDLLRLLVSSAKLPDVDLLEAELVASPHPQQGGALVELRFELTLYEVPTSLTEPVVIPFYRCRGTVEIAQYLSPTPLDIQVHPATSAPPQAARTPDIVSTRHEITIQAAGMLKVFGYTWLRDRDAPGETSSVATVTIDLAVVGASSSLSFKIPLERAEADGNWGRWVWRKR